MAIMAELVANYCLCCARETTSDRRLLCSEGSKDVLPTLLEFLHIEMCSTSSESPAVDDILQCTSCKHICRTCFRLLLQYNKLHKKLKENVINVLQSGLIKIDGSGTFPAIKRARITIPQSSTYANRKDSDLSVNIYLIGSHYMLLNILNLCYYNKSFFRLSLIMRYLE